MQQKGKTSLALALAIASVPTLTGTLAALPRTASAAELPTVHLPSYADWKFNASSAQGSAEDNTLVISDASGNRQRSGTGRFQTTAQRLRTF